MIRLRHSGLQPADVRELHCSGWERTSTGWHAVRLEKTPVQTVMASSPLIPLVSPASLSSVCPMFVLGFARMPSSQGNRPYGKRNRCS